MEGSPRPVATRRASRRTSHRVRPFDEGSDSGGVGRSLHFYVCCVCIEWHPHAHCRFSSPPSARQYYPVTGNCHPKILAALEFHLQYSLKARFLEKLKNL